MKPLLILRPEPGNGASAARARSLGLTPLQCPLFAIEPTPWSAPYDAVAGKNGEAWTGSMWTDRVSRLDIKSGQFTDYPLPRPTNIRRVFLDDTKSPGALWVGSNHGGSIIKVEPLE